MEKSLIHNRLVVYPVPEGAVLRTDFAVFIRSSKEQSWKAVPCYQVKVDMHDVRLASMAYFDFEGRVEVKIRYGSMNIYRVEVRPLSKKIQVEYTDREVYFTLEQKAKLSIEINGDRFHNLHLFAGEPLVDASAADNCMVKRLPGNLLRPSIHRVDELGYELMKMPKGRTLYFGPGIHYFEECIMRIPSDTKVYLAGGAVIIGAFVCSKVENISIYGRGVLYLAGFERFSGINGVRLSHAKNIEINGIHVINPPHYSVYVGGSDNILIKDVKAFSCEGWSDGIDMMSSTNVTVEDVFLRTSDDCIAIYGRRWDYNGNAERILIQNSVLWADVAHPTMIGTHGDYENEGNVLQQITFRNLDILEHHEAQENYLGCLTINAGDKNIIREVLYENINIEQFEHGKLFDIQVKWNKDYNPAPGGSIENIIFQNIKYDGCGEIPSALEGFSEDRRVANVVFENLFIRGAHILRPEQGNIHIGKYTDQITFK